MRLDVCAARRPRRSLRVHVAIAVLVATGATVTHAVPARATQTPTIMGSGVAISPGENRGSWCRAYQGGPPCLIGLAVEAAEALSEADFVGVCSGDCDLLLLGGTTSYQLLKCAMTVARTSADGRTTSTWLGAAQIEGQLVYGRGGWYLIRVDDGGPGRVDRLGVDLVPPGKAKVSDGRCGARNVRTTPLLAGDYVIGSS